MAMQDFGDEATGEFRHFSIGEKALKKYQAII